MKRQTGGAGGVDGEVLQVDYVKGRTRDGEQVNQQKVDSRICCYYLCEPHVLRKCDGAHQNHQNHHRHCHLLSPITHTHTHSAVLHCITHAGLLEMTHMERTQNSAHAYRAQRQTHPHTRLSVTGATHKLSHTQPVMQQ